MNEQRRAENMERIKKLCSQDFGDKFRKRNSSLQYMTSATHRDTVYNAADKDFLERRKKELGVTNNDILMIFSNLVGRVITDATLRRKLAGKSDFTATEIMVLSLILEIEPYDLIECFHLLPKEHSQNDF